MGTCEWTKQYGRCSTACVTWNVRCISMPAHRWTKWDYTREALIAAAIVIGLSALALWH